MSSDKQARAMRHQPTRHQARVQRVCHWLVLALALCFSTRAVWAKATVRESDGSAVAVLNDSFGNVLATLSGTNVNWSPVRLDGYGPEIGYQPPAPSPATPLAETLVWRSRNIDPSGFYCLGARYYDPLAGRFLSPDPLGHNASLDLYSFCGGDPINGFDPDGRCLEGAAGAVNNTLSGLGGLAKNAYFSMSYGLSSLAYGSDQANQWFGQNWQGLKNAVGGTAQSTYDVGAFASYALVSPFDNNLAYQAYGGSMDGLGVAADSLRGGSDKSTAYQFGYAGLNAAMMFLPIRVGPAADVAETSVTLANAERTTWTASSGAGQALVYDVDFAKIQEMQSQTALINSALDDFAKTRRTTAVLDTTGGRIAAGGAVKDLTSEQARIAQNLGMVAAQLPGFHAEFTALSEAWAQGWVPQTMTTSRNICNTCQANLTPLQPLFYGNRTVVFPRP